MTKTKSNDNFLRKNKRNLMAVNKKYIILVAKKQFASFFLAQFKVSVRCEIPTRNNAQVEYDFIKQNKSGRL